MTHSERVIEIAKIKNRLLSAMDAYVIAVAEKETMDILERRFEEIQKLNLELQLMQHPQLN